MFILLYLGVFLYYQSSFMFNPYLSMHITSIGGDFGIFATIISVSSFIISALQSYIGYLSDKIGSKRIIFVGTLITAISLVFMAFTTSKLLILVYYTLYGVGLGIVAPSLYAYIAKLKNKKGESYIPLYRSIQGIGVIIGPTLGGFLAEESLVVNMLMASLIVVVATVLFYLFFRSVNNGNNFAITDEKVILDEEEKFSFINAVKEVVINKKFIAMCVLFFIVEMAYDCIRINVSLVGEFMGENRTYIGMALSAYFVTFTLFQIQINKKIKMLPVRNSLLLMGALTFISCSLLIPNAPFIIIILSMGCIGLTLGSLFTYCNVVVSEMAPTEKKGTYLGVFNTMMPLTDIVSPIIVVYCFGINPRLPFIIASVLIIVFILITVIFINKDINIKAEE